MTDVVSVPSPVSEVEKWIVQNRVTGIKVEYRQTGDDTADTWVILTPFEGKSVEWRDTTFRQVAELRLGYATVCEPKYGLREKVEKRLAYEKSNARELATYRRLKAKFESDT